MMPGNDIQTGLALHRSGRYDEAAAVYGEVLAQDPSNVSALRLLGVLHSQRGDYDNAIMMLQAAVRFAPEAPELYNDLGNALKGKDALEEAIAAYDHALRLNPLFAEACFNRALAYERQGDAVRAEASYTLALQANTDLQEARFNRSLIRLRSQRLAEAVDDLALVRRARPGMPEAHLHYGRANQLLGRWAEAKAAFRDAIACAPEDVEGHSLLGTLLLMEGRLDEAASSLRTALAVKPDHAESVFHLGVVYLRLYDLDQANACFENARLLRPDRPEIYVHLGLTARRRGDVRVARSHLEHALALDPENADAHWYYADLLLLEGAYAEGWEHFEWRWKHQGFLTPRWDYKEPVWKGENPEGKTIFLLPEQGLGDTVQFVRYAELVKELGARVVLGSPRELADVLKSVPGVDHVVTTNREAPPFDLLCPLMSLPGLFRTTPASIPNRVPYVTAEKALVEAWRSRIPDNGTMRIGVIWSGNPAQENNRHRACVLADLIPLGNVPGVTLYSLQKGPPASQLDSPPSGMEIFNLADGLVDFSDTAAVLELLDLLVTTDTGPAHLAGAMGRPVWVLLSAIPDWRWFLGTERSPWYPSMRLFRQERVGEWSSVIARVGLELRQAVAHHKSMHVHQQAGH